MHKGDHFFRIMFNPAPDRNRCLGVDSVYFPEVVSVDAVSNGQWNHFRPLSQAPEHQFPVVDPASVNNT